MTSVRRFNWLDVDDNRPLPELIIRELGGTILVTEGQDGKRLYCVRDWVYYVSGSRNEKHSVAWYDLKRSLVKEGNEKVYENFIHLTVDTPGGPQSTEFTTAEGLYQITQCMATKSETVRWVKKYLAAAGVIVDNERLDPATRIAELGQWLDEKEYNRLINEGFTPDEAQQWLKMRAEGKKSRRLLTDEWKHRGVAQGKDFARLTNDVNVVALGETVTEEKKAMQLRKSDTPRDYLSAAKLALIEVTESLSRGLHVGRDSQGTDELSEDVHDTEPMINRDEVYAAFSKKHRRLPGEQKPPLTGKK